MPAEHTAAAVARPAAFVAQTQLKYSEGPPQEALEHEVQRLERQHARARVPRCRAPESVRRARAASQARAGVVKRGGSLGITTLATTRSSPGLCNSASSQ